MSPRDKKTRDWRRNDRPEKPAAKPKTDGAADTFVGVHVVTSEEVALEGLIQRLTKEVTQ